MKRATKNQIITIIILIIFLGSSLTYAILSFFPTEDRVQPNWRARLAIIVFGDSVEIPSGIGTINETTNSKLYTLNNDGIVYKQGSEDAKLGEFFDIWNKTFNSTCILDYCNTANNSMRMYIYTGDKQVENFEYENYLIKNMDVIIIDYR